MLYLQVEKQWLRAIYVKQFDIGAPLLTGNPRMANVNHLISIITGIIT
jgi:hypothetical protein